MVKKHVAFATANKWCQAPFCKKEDILNLPNKWCQAPFCTRPHFVQKMGPVTIYSAPFILKASLSSPPEGNHTRSAPLTVFSPYSLRHAREPDGVGRRVCLSGASYADAEKSEWRMALKI